MPGWGESFYELDGGGGGTDDKRFCVGFTYDFGDSVLELSHCALGIALVPRTVGTDPRLGPLFLGPLFLQHLGDVSPS